MARETRALLGLPALEQRIGYAFKDIRLLERAVTHRSYASEHYERLEFLGDSVLNCVIGHALYLRDQHFDEGVLSRVRANFVCEGTLDEIAARLEIPRFVRLGEGELRSGGASRPSIIADVCEAIFGAVFLDGGFEEARRVVLALYEPIFATAATTPGRLGKDPKTVLQEILQARHEPLPVYEIVSTEGAQHNPLFHCVCRVPGHGISERGSGKSRRSAEQQAAARACQRLERLQGGKGAS